MSLKKFMIGQGQKGKYDKRNGISPRKAELKGLLRLEVREGKMKRLSGASMSHGLTRLCLSPQPGSSHST